MNIRAKTLLVIAFSLIISALGSWLVLEQLAYPTFARLEEQSALKNMQRALEAINGEVENISVTLWDYSNWDEAYRYATGDNKDFAANNLNYDNLSKFAVDIVEMYDQKLRLIYNTKIDPEKPEISWLLSSLYPDLLSTTAGMDPDQGKKGIVLTPNGVIMFAVRPVLQTNGEGPATGTLIFGRFLEKRVVSQIKQKTKIDFDLLPLDRAVDSHGINLVSAIRKQDAPLVLKDAPTDRLLTYSLLRDYFGKPVLVARSTIGRDITASGRQVIWASMVGIAVSGLLVMGATALLLQWLLIGPLVRLTQQIVSIGRNGNLSQDVALGRTDEIGVLSREFNKMLGRLAQARDQLLEHSYNSGLAEMAAGVLHNLRNHMTPLSMRIGRLHEHLSRTGGSKLARAYEELIEAFPDGERKAKLAKYVGLSLREISERNQQVLQRLERISDDLRRLDEALSELDRFGRSSNHLTRVQLRKILQETICQLPHFPELYVNIVIDPRLEDRVTVLSTPFILKHILHNLLVNACEAILATGRRQGRIDILQVQSVVDGKEMVDLQVRDDGIGIAQDHLENIFSRGFTTKIGERRGTGLHWCANSTAKMGGRLFATSSGINRGSVFHLLLPLVEVNMSAAA
jgi:sensor domain CHASE-containing protein